MPRQELCCQHYGPSDSLVKVGSVAGICHGVTATVLSRSHCHTVQRLGAAAWMAGMEGSSDGTGRWVNNIIATVEPLLYDHPQNHIGVVV